jgi:5-methylcytosine-specific restriction endonuclease McrA
MPWVRIDENAMEHPKVAALPDSAFRLWVTGLAHCQKFLTDGKITANALKTLRTFSPKRSRQLIEAGLWVESDTGDVHVHDYLEWNDSRQTVLDNRDWGKRRRELYADPALLAQIRNRDKDCCRYCGKSVNWKDRRGPLGGTYDHVIARGPNTAENVVVACRGCNASKGDKPVEQCGMRLLSVPELGPNQIGLRRHISGVGGVGSSAGKSEEERGVGKTREERAGDFCEWYSDTHQRLFGIGYMGTNGDYTKALELVEKFTDAELRDGALVWFGMDDDFAKNGTRTVPKFASRITGCLQEARARGIA